MPYVPHKNGRPARSDEPARPRTFRFTDEEFGAIAGHSHAYGVAKSELIRAACEAAGLFGDAPLKPAFLRLLPLETEDAA